MAREGEMILHRGGAEGAEDKKRKTEWRRVAAGSALRRLSAETAEGTEIRRGGTGLARNGCGYCC